MIGEPTIYERGESARHFLLSAAVAALVTPSAAESAGLVNEMQDAREGVASALPTWPPV